MLNLILSAAGGGKTAMIIEDIAQRAAAGEKDLFLIVPEQYSHEAERELCSVCGDRASLHSEVLSFTRLSHRVDQELGTGGRSYLDPGGRMLCMNLALREISGSLILYSDALRNIKLQQELLEAVEELRSACVTPNTLTSMSGQVSSNLSAKLTDLALCLEAYEAVLSNGRADSAHRLHRLAQTLKDSSLGRHGRFYIDGFTDFTGLELDVIEAMLALGAPVTVCLTCDELHTLKEHFQPAAKAARTLKRMAERLGVEVKISKAHSRSDKGREKALSFFTEHLFSHTREKPPEPRGAIALFRAPDIYSECELAAARALELVRETNCRWSDIAIAARGFEDYRAPLEESFRLYGVPLFTVGSDSMANKPLPAFIRTAFRVLEGGWDTDDVLNYIKTGLTGLDREDADLLAGYVSLWSLRGSVWKKAEAWTQHPDGYDKDTTSDSAARLEKIDSLRRRLAAPLLELERQGKEASTAAGQARALADFFGSISLPDTLAHHTEALDRSGLSRRADESAQLWNLVCRALTQTAEILGNRFMTQEEFSGLFLLTLSRYDISTIPGQLDGASAGELDRMRRRHIKHLIILGASDDRMPRPAERGFPLTEEDRESLSLLGLELGGEDPLSREFALIYNCVSLPSETLSISYCAADKVSNSHNPGVLISRAQTLFGAEIKAVSLRKLRLSSPGSALLLAAQCREGGMEGAAARAYFTRTQNTRLRLASLDLAAKKGPEDLSPTAVTALYGPLPRISPSRADSFFSCPYQYFLRYGLRLNEKEKAGFQAPEFGTYTHYILENCAKEISASSGFENASEELVEALTDKYTDKYISEKLGSLEDKSPRFVFLFNRLRRPVARVVWDMVRELANSDFRPIDFELSFGVGGQLPPIRIGGENGLDLVGVADRVDGCFRDGKLWLRVIDYKTGKKSFSFSDLWHGTGMQLLLYLFALEDRGEALYGTPVESAGVLYVPARDTVISSPGDLAQQELADQMRKAHRRSGLLLNDPALLLAMERSIEPEYLPVKYKNGVPSNSGSLADKNQFALLREYVEGKLLELSTDLKGGTARPHPCYKNATENSCTYCPYKKVCRFDLGLGPIKKLETVKASEFWSRLGGEDL